MTNYYDQVAAAVAEFVPPLTSPLGNDHLEDEAKGLATRRAAWRIYQTDPNVGLLEKLSGSQSSGLSTDVLIHRADGSWADCMTTTVQGAVRVVEAVWIDHGPSTDPAWLARWRQPTAALAGLEPGEPPVPPTNPPDGDLEDRVRELELENEQQAADIAALRTAVAGLGQALEATKKTIPNAVYSTGTLGPIRISVQSRLTYP